MNHKEAFKILSDYKNHCEQKIKNIEKEVKVKALVSSFNIEFYPENVKVLKA